MGLRSILKTTKGRIAFASAGIVIAAGIAAAVLLINGNTYRSITAKSVSGIVIVTGDINNGQAYAGERLYGGDDISVMETSSLTMLMDNDKYLFADENTHFLLETDQSGNNNRIRIVLDKGSELNELRSSLRAGDSYDVDTPNSTMSVRGTKFRVTVVDIDGTTYTLVEVTNGVVSTRLRTASGVDTGSELSFVAGESVIIKGTRDSSEYVRDKNGETVRHLDLSRLPSAATERLIALLSIKTGEEIANETDGTVSKPETSLSATTIVTSAEITDISDDTTVPPPETSIPAPVIPVISVTAKTTTNAKTTITTAKSSETTTKATTVTTVKKTTTTTIPGSSNNIPQITAASDSSTVKPPITGTSYSSATEPPITGTSDSSITEPPITGTSYSSVTEPPITGTPYPSFTEPPITGTPYSSVTEPPITGTSYSSTTEPPITGTSYSSTTEPPITGTSYSSTEPPITGTSNSTTTMPIITGTRWT
ncbi:MAG: FecR domain-containing protein [Ruminiclostridium sp.]|nr:FecR domain-containing protein [Ruminiclostridium sp.]